MDLFQNLSRDICHHVLQSLEVKEVYLSIRCINKYFNNCVRLLRYDKIKIGGKRLEKMLELSKKYGDTFSCPKYVTFYDCICLETWDFVKKFKLQKIHYNHCSLCNDIFVPNNVTLFGVSFCSNVNVKEIITKLEKEKNTLSTLFFEKRDHFDDGDIRALLSFKLKELFLESGLVEGKRMNMTKSHLELLNLDELCVLQMNGFYFDDSCNNLACLKNHNLKYIALIGCNIEPVQIPNITSSSLKYLSLAATNITDEFIEQLCFPREKNIINVTHLNISYTLITEKCFEYLSTFNLVTLAIRGCLSVKNLLNLNISSLKDLSVADNDFSDDDIGHVSKHSPHMEILDIRYNKNITDGTLGYIKENITKLEQLHASHTGITPDGILAYLSNMNLHALTTTECVGRKNDEFIKANVVQPDLS